MVRATPHIHHHPTLDFDQLHRSNDAHIFTTSTTSDRQTSNHISGRYISWALYSFLVGFFGVICIISVISSFVRLWYMLWLQDLDVIAANHRPGFFVFGHPRTFPGWMGLSDFPRGNWQACLCITSFHRHPSLNTHDSTRMTPAPTRLRCAGCLVPRHYPWIRLGFANNTLLVFLSHRLSAPQPNYMRCFPLPSSPRISISPHLSALSLV